MRVRARVVKAIICRLCGTYVGDVPSGAQAWCRRCGTWTS